MATDTKHLVTDEDAAHIRRVLDGGGWVESLLDTREALIQALISHYPEPHYGEPEGLQNCARNGAAYPLTDEELASPASSNVAHLDMDCDCGAEELNAPTRALVAQLRGSDA